MRLPNKTAASAPAENKRNDCCGIVLRLVLVILMITALVTSFAVLASCDFIEVSSNNSTANQFNSSSATFGLFRYDPDGQGCRSLQADDVDISWDTVTGQVGLLVTVGAGGVVLLLLFLELICCRFGCSRCISIALLVLAILGMSVTFFTYASSFCRSQAVYPCSPGQGTYLAIASTSLYVLASFVTCVAPRPTPIMVRLLEEDKTDPCICSRRKPKKEKEEEKEPEGDLEEAEPPTGKGAIDETDSHPSQVVYDDDAASADESTIHPSGMSVVTMPVFSDAAVLDGDLYFDAATVA